MTEDFVLHAAVRGFLEPVGKRSAYTASRLAILADGSTVPVLLLLAKRKFAKGWPPEQFPFWVDGNRENELLSNVDLATRVSQARQRRLAKHPYGSSKNSKEYMKRWREANRPKVRAAQARYVAKRRALLAKLEAQLADDPLFAKLRALAASPPDLAVTSNLERRVEGRSEAEAVPSFASQSEG